MDCSAPGFPVLQYFPEFAQAHVYWVSDAILLSYPLPPPSPFAFNLSQLQGLFQWVSSLIQVVKVLTAVSLCGLRWFKSEQKMIYYSRFSCSLSYLGFCDNGIRGINIRDQQIFFFFLSQHINVETKYGFRFENDELSWLASKYCSVFL